MLDSNHEGRRKRRMLKIQGMKLEIHLNGKIVSPIVNAASIEDNVVDENIVYGCADDPNIPNLEEIGTFTDAEDDGAEADMTNLDTHIPVSHIPTSRIHKDHPVKQIIVDIHSAPQTRRMTKSVTEHAMFRFEDPNFPDKVYKVENALYGLHQAPRAWYETLSTYLLDNGFQRGKIDKTLFIRMDKGLQVKQKEDGIFISQDKYVIEILKKFGFTDVKTASTPTETQKPLLKDEDGEEVDVHLYRSMISSLMYLTSSRPDIMFVVCACYPKDSPFDLVAYTNSDYVGSSLDKKSTKGGCQLLGCRFISWQCKKQTVVANSTTEAEYVDASSCCG
ncbi:putative ribonuclease H-like domain-containing protein [Tanacetum coccineum]